MDNKKEIPAIIEEWQYMQRNSGISHSISVHGGWLQAVIPRLFERIVDLELELDTVVGERALVEMSLDDEKERNDTLIAENHGLGQDKESLEEQLSEAQILLEG